MQMEEKNRNTVESIVRGDDWALSEDKRLIRFKIGSRCRMAAPIPISNR